MKLKNLAVVSFAGLALVVFLVWFLNAIPTASAQEHQQCDSHAAQCYCDSHPDQCKQNDVHAHPHEHADEEKIKNDEEKIRNEIINEIEKSVKEGARR
jgi:hypothetical protein